MDIVEHLRDLKLDVAANEIESLRQQLAECEREREGLIGRPVPLSDWQKMEISNARMRSVLNDFDNPYQVGDVWQWTGPAPEDIDAALAKVGADKTGEK